jgi:hypothetical protein
MNCFHPGLATVRKSRQARRFIAGVLSRLASEGASSARTVPPPQS